MIPLLPAVQTTAVWLAVSTLGFVFLRFLLPSWWGRPLLRWSFLSLLATPGLGLASWQLGPLLHSWTVSYYGMAAAWSALVPVGFAVLSLPVAALFQRLANVPRRSTPPPDSGQRPLGRRELLSMAGAIVPTIAFGTGTVGWAGAAQRERIPFIPLRFDGLPNDLLGFRILHLSDLHLGCNKHVADLERLLLRAEPRGVDLVVVTGDVADDLRQLHDALGLLKSFPARHGTYVCLGNHEYLRDIGRALRIFERGGLPLLVNDGAVLAVGNATLFLAGVDDPGYRPVVLSRFYAQSVDRAMDGAPADAFTLLLSHRPRGFLQAARRGVDLTLAGHTHGNQIAPFGRGGLRSVDGEPFVWGTYERGPSRLYTTSGFGHWFPYRLGCPAEVPLIELQRV